MSVLRWLEIGGKKNIQRNIISAVGISFGVNNESIGDRWSWFCWN
jgi:hypothetical protein